MGDLALSLHVGHWIAQRDRGEPVPKGIDARYPFSHVHARIREADIALGNLECVVSPKGVLETDTSALRGPVQSIRVLKDSGIDLVSIANNHTMDFGRRAFDDMVSRLTDERLPFIGGGSYNSGPEEPLIVEVHGLKIGFLGFYLRLQHGAARDVARARPKVDVLVVFNHWGREHLTELSGGQQKLGRGLIDAGADVVVGAHAHVLQAEEWYKGKLIYYGLGNFVFSGMSFDERHRVGGYLEVEVGPSGLIDRRLYRTRLDGDGAPHWLDESPTEPPRVADSEVPNLARATPLR